MPSEIEIALNEKIAPIIKKLERKMNMYTVPYGDLQPGNMYHLVQIVNVGGGVTHFPSDSDAFNLNPPVAGNIKNTLITDRDKRRLCIRRIYGYAGASRP